MAHTRGGHMTVVSAIEAVDIWRENWVTDADNVTSRFTSYNLSSRDHQLTAEVVVKMGWKFNGLTAKWKYFHCPQSKINQFPPKDLFVTRMRSDAERESLADFLFEFIFRRIESADGTISQSCLQSDANTEKATDPGRISLQ